MDSVPGFGTCEAGVACFAPKVRDGKRTVVSFVVDRRERSPDWLRCAVFAKNHRLLPSWRRSWCGVVAQEGVLRTTSCFLFQTKRLKGIGVVPENTGLPTQKKNTGTFLLFYEVFDEKLIAQTNRQDDTNELCFGMKEMISPKSLCAAKAHREIRSSFVHLMKGLRTAWNAVSTVQRKNPFHTGWGESVQCLRERRTDLQTRISYFENFMKTGRAQPGKMVKRCKTSGCSWTQCEQAASRPVRWQNALCM